MSSKLDLERDYSLDDPAHANWTAYIRARDSSGHKDWVKVAKKCDDYVCGDQWDEKDRQKLDREGRPALTINATSSIVNTLVGEHLSRRADVRFKSATPSQEDADDADALTKTWLFDANRVDYDTLESDMFEDGIVMDRGYMDMRIGFDANFRGNTQFRVLDPLTVIPDPDAKEYDPDSWKFVIRTEWVSLDDIEMAYGKKARDKVASTGEAVNYGADSIRFDSSETFGGDDPGDAFMRAVTDAMADPGVRMVRIIERQHVKLSDVVFFVDPLTGDAKEAHPTWGEEQVQAHAERFGLQLETRQARRIRWTVTCDRHVLFDDWSPYRHYTIVPFFPYFRRGKPRGMVRHLLSPQDQLNKTMSQELHVINTTANSGWIVDEGALRNMTEDELRAHGSETGLVIVKNPQREIEKIQPNQIPTGLDRVSMRALGHMKDISGVNDAMMGDTSPEVSGVAFEKKEARGQVQLGRPFANLARTRRMIVRNWVDLVQQFYTEERLMMITDPEQPDQQEAVTINQSTAEGRVLNDITRGQYNIVISSMPSRDTFDETQFVEMIELRNIGVQIPDDRIVERSNLSGKRVLAEEVRAMQGRGTPSPEEQAMMQIQRELQMQMAMLAVRELQGKIMKLEAEATKIAAEASMKEGGMQSPEIEIKLREIQAEMVRSRNELNTRLRLAEMSQMRDVDLEVLRGLNSQAQEAERRITEVTKAKVAPKPSPHPTER